MGMVSKHRKGRKVGVKKVMKDSAAATARRIMVVDDDPMVGNAIKMMLEVDGHQVQLVAGGREALERFAIDKFDLVFTDFAMPGMNGHELATAIKARAPEQPIIMITAYADLFLSSQPLPNLDYLLSKPCLLSQLREAVEHVMTKCSVRPAQLRADSVSAIEN